jgi:hypothetical protein
MTMSLVAVDLLLSLFYNPNLGFVRRVPQALGVSLRIDPLGNSNITVRSIAMPRDFRGIQAKALRETVDLV